LNDLTGKKLFLKNAFVSWSVHILIVIAGFIVPRQIDHSLGPVHLGIWDLGWATVQYMTLTGFGVGAALNRYIGMFRASGDIEAMNRYTTAAFIWQIFVAVLILLISLILSWSMQYWVDLPDGSDLFEAQLVLFMLGLSLAIKMLFDHTGGLLAGYHLWWLLNGLMAFQDFIQALLLVAILLLGGDLIDLSLSVLLVSFIATIIRLYLVKKYCREVKVDFSLWDYDAGKQLLLFGVKNFVSRIGTVVVFQTASVLLVAFIGPIALALFNRSVALVRQVDMLVRKVATMFVPITSSLIGMQKQREAKAMILHASLLGMSLTFPALLILMVYGDVLLMLWMGKDYANHLLIVILALGSIFPVGTAGTFSVLAGFNVHGKMSLYSLLVTLVVMVGGSLIVHYFEWTVINVAILCGISMTLGRMLTMPVILKSKFGIGYIEFLISVLFKPIYYNSILIACWFASKYLYTKEDYVISAVLFLLGCIASFIIYWRIVIPGNIKKDIVRIIRQKLPNSKMESTP